MTAPVPMPAAPVRAPRGCCTYPGCGVHTGRPRAALCDAHRGWRKRGPTPRLALTPERAAYIRAHYRPTVPGVLKRVAAALQVPEWRVRRWAADLGVCQTKAAPWTADELAFLERHATTRHPNWIARHLPGRSALAVIAMATKRHLRRRASRDWWTARLVGEGFGVAESVVLGWIRQGLLEAERWGQDHPNGDAYAWQITPAGIRAFVQAHPTLFVLWKVDQPWFLDIVFEGRLGERREQADGGARG